MPRPRSMMLCAAALCLAPSARAADRPLDLAFNLGAASDYVFRGVSQTGGRPEAYGGADVVFGRLGYAGAWLSNVRLGGRNGMEYDLYAGARPNLGPVSLDVGMIRYGYSERVGAESPDFFEWKALASLPLGPATLGAGVYHAPQLFGRLGSATYYELNASYQAPGARFSVSGAAGRQTVSRAHDYSTWNLGLGYAATERLGFDLRYWGADPHALGGAAGNRVVVGFKAGF